MNFSDIVFLFSASIVLGFFMGVGFFLCYFLIHIFGNYFEDK